MAKLTISGLTYLQSNAIATSFEEGRAVLDAINEALQEVSLPVIDNITVDYDPDNMGYNEIHVG